MNGRTWTPAERRQITLLRDQGKTYREIAKIMGRPTRHSIAGQARRGRPEGVRDDGDIYETDAQADLRKQLYGEARYA